MPGTSLDLAADQTAILTDIEGDLLAPERPELASLVHWRGSAEEPLHRWYRYREAFAPSLIDALDLPGPILDPFAGCGSILIGAAQRQIAATGVDLNPLAAFVTRVKLTPLSAGQMALVAEYREALSARIRTRQWPLPNLTIADKVFEPEIRAELLRARALLEKVAVGDPRLRDFLLLAWLSVLEEVGSFFKEGNGVKYRNRRRTANGYVSRVDGEWQEARFGTDQGAFVRECLAAAVGRMIDDAALWATGAWDRQTVIEGSALDLDGQLGEARFNSIVFSPPYANRFDYFESMKVELWFGGFVESAEEMRALRKASLRSHLGADLSRPWREIPALERVLERMDRESSSWKMRVPDVLRGYFDDMATVLAECRKRLEPGGECHVVVGNSAYAGTIVPTDALLARLGVEEAGFEGAKVVPVRHLTVAPQQRALLSDMQGYMRESVVTLW